MMRTAITRGLTRPQLWPYSGTDCTC